MARIVQVVVGSQPEERINRWWRVADADLPLLRYAFAVLEPDGDPFPVSTLAGHRGKKPEMLMVQPGLGYELDEETHIVEG